MRFKFAPVVAIIVTLGLTACNKAESPDKVQAEVDKASQEAAASAAKADETRKQTETQATEDLVKAKADAQTQAVDKQIAAVADQAVTEATGETNIALAKCKALEGDAQKQCKDDANAHLKVVKERAEAAKHPDKDKAGNGDKAGTGASSN